MRIAIGQMRVRSANCFQNFSAMRKQIEAAAKQNVQCIIFPEMSLPGYFNGDTWEQSTFLLECEKYHNEIKKLSKSMDIVFGSIGIDWKKKNEDGRVRKYNAIYHAHKGKFLKNQKTKYFFWVKTLMPNYREFDDSRHFYDLRKLAIERNCKLVDLYEPLLFKDGKRTLKVGISVCEDAWSENYSIDPILLYAQKFKHDFFLNLSCSPFTKGKVARREKLFQNLSNKIKQSIIYVNSVGTQNVGKTIYGFDGSSTLFEPRKKCKYIGGFYSEDLSILDFDFKAKSFVNIMPKNLFNNHYEMSEVQISLESILKYCLEEWGIERVLIGVSGGVDSALSATLFTRVLGSKSVYLVNMPSNFNSSLTKNSAEKLAHNLKCPFGVVPIVDSISFTKEQLSHVQFTLHAQQPQVTSIVFENIQARDRGSRILAALAQSLGAAFSCNANKTEMTIGYSTLYGDLCGFIAPIADLWKQDVYALCRHYNDNVFEYPVIPVETLEVIPSAELSDEQDVMQNKGDPLCYPYHDKLFASWVEHWDRKTPEVCLQSFINGNLHELIGCEKSTVSKLFPTTQSFVEDLERWWKLYRGMAAFKRVQAPPVIAVTRRAFGFDHREHIGNSVFYSEFFSLKTQRAIK